MDPKLRQRGWSLSSNSSHPSSPPKSSSTTGTTSSSSGSSRIVVVGHANPNNNDSNSNHHDNDHNDNQSNHGHCTTRPRSNTDYSEDTLGTVEKMELLQSYPTHHSDDDDDEDDEDDGHEGELYENVGCHDDDDDDNDDDNDGDAVQDAADEEEEDDDVMEMFGDSESDTRDTIHDEMLQPQKKRMKLDTLCSTERETDLRWSGIIENTVIDNEHENEHRNEHKDDKEERLQRAKDKMSKWAKRLFDPNRPRGLVETPEYIPLNDEFLAQFGKREREYYERVGDKIELDKDDNLDDVDDDISQEDKGEGEDETKHSKDHNVRKDKQGGTKIQVKISNLAYTTTEQALTRLCETYGPVMEIKLPTDENNPSRSKGRAYVTFQLHSDAEGFLQDMHEKVFEGRILRIVPAADRPSASSSSSKLGGGRDSLGGGMVGGMGGKKRTRYWEKNDITTKCFRCGQVGHMVTSCPNDEIAKPCPLCAKTGHDSYSCPLNKICFNCGVPGHINRECPERRGMPRRMVCGACFISGHHKWECRERVHAIPSYGAKCMVCGIDGHFMCTDMKWFFGLRGISCFNCGRKGHHGSMCDRPTVDECARNSDVLLKELEFAEAKSIEDELEEVRQRRRDEQYERERGRRRLDSNGERDRKRDRAKSQPASRFRPNNNQSSRYGRL